MSGGEFSVVEFYDDHRYAYVERGLDAESAAGLAKLCTEAATAIEGFVVKIIITDGGDYTVFQWEHRKGITFPPQRRKAGGGVI